MNKPIQVKRSDMIQAHHVKQGILCLVHSGMTWVTVRPTAEMISHKFGEFVKTRINRPPVKKAKMRKK